VRITVWSSCLTTSLTPLRTRSRLRGTSASNISELIATVLTNKMRKETSAQIRQMNLVYKRIDPTIKLSIELHDGRILERDEYRQSYDELYSFFIPNSLTIFASRHGPYQSVSSDERTVFTQLNTKPALIWRMDHTCIDAFLSNDKTAAHPINGLLESH